MTNPSVALLGSRGIPARYGGYETLLEELAPRLVARGFRVTVYGRTHAVRRRVRRFRGAEIVLLPCLRSKCGYHRFPAYISSPLWTTTEHCLGIRDCIANNAIIKSQLFGVDFDAYRSNVNIARKRNPKIR